jgi:UDP-N-acetylglucosamine 2-epimerase (non-hydrolysing)
VVDVKPRSVAIVLGTRPEAIKLAPVYLELQTRPRLEPLLIATGQHREMLNQVLEVFELTPDLNFDIMEHGQTLAGVTARAITVLDQAFEERQPDIVLVQGDTASTFVGALTAYYRQIDVGHVEAGLRSGDKYSPFPEEVFRRLTAEIADLHFAATTRARDNLLSEGVDPDAVFVTGNTVIDALHQTRAKLPTLSGTEFEWADKLNGRILLVTAHRRENLGVPFTRICTAIADIVRRFDDLTVIFPMHLNPKVRGAATELLGGLDRVHLCEPLDYVTFVPLMARADLIITDSGGIQEEAPALGVPVLVVRDTTERPEGVDAGVVRLVGTETGDIFDAAQELLTSATAYARMAGGGSPYGDGRAAERICDAIEYAAGLREDRPEDFVYEPRAQG